MEIHSDVSIGNNNIIDSMVSIGSDGEIRDAQGFKGHVVIGDHNIIKEFVTIQKGAESTSITEIGSHCMLMSKSHVGHDAYIHDKCTLATGVKIGGHAIIYEGVNIGLNATIHQRVEVGAYSMVGMLTPVVKNIYPFSKVAGSPCRILGCNKYSLDKMPDALAAVDWNYCMQNGKAFEQYDVPEDYLTTWK